jgi:chemosensory pili system protein ChpA (sensor histidine kinase/response regulator)
MEYDAEIMLAFLEEFEGYLPQFRAHLARLETKSKDRDAIDECHRLAHTIKGTAATMGLTEISQQGLAMEQALLPVVEKKAPYTPDVGMILRARLERVEHLLEELQRQYQEPPAVPASVASLPPPVATSPAPAQAAGFELDFNFDEDLAQVPGFSSTDHSIPDFRAFQPASATPPKPSAPEPTLQPFSLDFDAPSAPAPFTLDSTFQPEAMPEPFSLDNFGVTPEAAPPSPKANAQPEPAPFTLERAYEVPSGGDDNFDWLSPAFTEPDSNADAAIELLSPQNQNTNRHDEQKITHPLFTPLDYFDLGPELEQELAAEQRSKTAANSDSFTTEPGSTETGFEQPNLAHLSEFLQNSSSITFEHFEPQIDDTSQRAVNAELNEKEFVMADWIAPASGTGSSSEDSQSELEDESLLGLKGFSLDDLLTNPELDEQVVASREPTPPSVSTQPGFEIQALPNDIPTGEVSLFKPDNLPGFPPPVDLSEFEDISSVPYRADLGSVQAFDLSDSPDDFTDAADLLAQFDTDPGMLVEGSFPSFAKTNTSEPVKKQTFEQPVAFEPSPLIAGPEMQSFVPEALPETEQALPFVFPSIQDNSTDAIKPATFEQFGGQAEPEQLPEFDFDFVDEDYSNSKAFQTEFEAIRQRGLVDQPELAAFDDDLEPASFEDQPTVRPVVSSENVSATEKAELPLIDNFDEKASYAVEAPVVYEVASVPVEEVALPAPEIPGLAEAESSLEPASEAPRLKENDLFDMELTPEEAAALAELEAAGSAADGENLEMDFDMGALWLAEAQSDIDKLKDLVADFGEDEDNERDARKINEIVVRLRKGAEMMDLEGIARQLGVIETASQAIIGGELQPYMSGRDILSYELATLMILLEPFEEGARDYLTNVEAEQAAALAATAAPVAAPAKAEEPSEEAAVQAEPEIELAEPVVDLTSMAATAAPSPAVSSASPAGTPPVGTPPAGVEVDEELAMVFADEAEEHIQNLDTRLAQLERNPSNRELLREIRRTAHTLKGSAAMVGFQVISQTAHLMEDLLDRLYDGSLEVSEDVVQLLFITFNAIDNMVRGLAAGKTEDVSRLEMLRPRYAELLSGAAQEEQGAGGIIIFEKKARPVPAAIRAAQEETLVTRAFSEEDLAAIEAAQAEQAAQEQAELTAATPAVAASTALPETEIAARVPIKRLDGMMNQVGELVINRTVLERRNQILMRTAEELALSIKRLQRVSRELETRYEVELLKNSAAPLMSATAAPYRTNGNGFGISGEELPYGPEYGKSSTTEFDTLEMDQYTEFHTLSREMSETVADLAAAQRELENLRNDLENVTIQQSRITDDLQDKLVKVRLMSISNLTPRLYRTIRTLAASQNKEIEFVVSGENTQVDKTIFEEIGDPLLHMIRNAVDHGVESPEERVSQGKPAKATITFVARNEGSQVVIEVRDDGRGMNTEELRQRAVEKGLVKADAQLTREEIFDLIFLPGFSTSVTISEISGRGIGMDVVRASVLKLKGSIETQSEEGKGTTFIIRLPTTLAITRAMLVRANGYSYAIPLNVVEQTTRFEAELVDHYGSRPAYKLESGYVPLLELGQILRLPEHAQRGPDPEDEDKPGLRREQPLLVINGPERVVLRVDKLLGQQEVVVKNLGTHIKYVPGVIGATTLGSGEVILILNVYDLIEQTIGKRSRSGTGVAGVNLSGRAAWQRVRSEIQARRGMTGMLGQAPRPAERRNPLIQVVDDSLSMRKVLSGALEKAGYRVRTSKDGQEALETIQQSAPDLIIMDIEMPRMDGYELTSILKGRESFYQIPVVMLTSRAGIKHRQKAEEVGADGFLVKPYKEEELLQIVATLLERARAQV